MSPRRRTPLPKPVQWVLMLAILALVGLLLLVVDRACAEDPVRVAIADEEMRAGVEQALTTADELLAEPRCRSAFNGYTLEPATFRALLFVDGRSSLICRRSHVDEYTYRGGTVVNVCPIFLGEPLDYRPLALIRAGYASIGVPELQGQRYSAGGTKAVRKACEVIP